MPETKRFQIVVVEDNLADVRLVREALKLHAVDCEISVISDGAEAISYFRGLDLNSRSPAPDLVLLDMHLPKYDGNEILYALRSAERSAKTPVVVMTSSTTAEFEKVAQKHEALNYFRKPSNWDEYTHLGNVVRAILENAKGSPETAQTPGTTE